jgi:hypothetical protein
VGICRRRCRGQCSSTSERAKHWWPFLANSLGGASGYSLTELAKVAPFLNTVCWSTSASVSKR